MSKKIYALKGIGSVSCPDIYHERNWTDRYNNSRSELCTNYYNGVCRNQGYTGMADVLGEEDLYAVAKTFQSMSNVGTLPINV